MLSDNVIMRTTIDIPGKQLAALDAWRAKENLSRSEAMRRVLETALSERRATQSTDSFGSWKPRKNKRNPVRSMREEWTR